jgi:hypothetical protein
MKNVKHVVDRGVYLYTCGFFVKGPAVDATDAPQPWGLLCNPVMMIVFSFFLVIEHRWNEIDRRKPKYSGKNLSHCHFVHHKSHMYWPPDRTRASAVRGRRLTAWAMARRTYGVNRKMKPENIKPISVLCHFLWGWTDQGGMDGRAMWNAKKGWKSVNKILVRKAEVNIECVSADGIERG